MKWWDWRPWSSFFWMLSFKPAFTLSSFTLIGGSSVTLHFLPLRTYHLHIYCWYFSQQSYSPYKTLNSSTYKFSCKYYYLFSLNLRLLSPASVFSINEKYKRKSDQLIRKGINTGRVCPEDKKSSFSSISKHYHYKRKTLKFYVPTSEIRNENFFSKNSFLETIFEDPRILTMHFIYILPGEMFKDRVPANSS